MRLKTDSTEVSKQFYLAKIERRQLGKDQYSKKIHFDLKSNNFQMKKRPYKKTATRIFSCYEFKGNKMHNNMNGSCLF